MEVQATDLEDRIIRKFSEVLDIDKDYIESSNVIADFGISSVDAVSIASELINEFDLVDLPLNILYKASTIESLVDLCMGTTTESIDESLIDLAAEAALDSSIHIPDEDYIYDTDPGAVLLTGATGFLGAYLLKELLDMTRAKIFCLVRAEDDIHAFKRIYNNLSSLLKVQELNLERVIPVKGDFSKEKMGLPESYYDYLSSRIDHVYHNGALVNFMVPYSSMKKVNVGGTEQIIKFATAKKLKAVHYISSFSVFMADTYLHADLISQDTELEHFENLPNNYVRTKWVSERMITNAAKKGLPVNIYRPGFIFGDQSSGFMRTDDYTPRMIKSWCQLGMAAAVEGEIDITPVDYVCKAIVSIARNAEAFGQSFNLANPRPVNSIELIDKLCEKGFPIQKVSYGRWLNAVLEAGRGNAMFELGTTFLQAPEDMSVENLYLNPKLEMRNVEQYKDPSIVCPKAIDLVDFYIDTFIKQGYLSFAMK